MAILKDLIVQGKSKFLRDIWGTIFHGDVDGTASFATSASTAADSVKLNGQSASYYASSSHTHSYVPLAGGTMSGILKFNRGTAGYADALTSGGLDMNNSNIIGVNSIYTADASDNSSEGIHFYRDTTHVDTLWASSGGLYFSPNRTIGSGTSAANSNKVWHAGNDGSGSGLDADTVDGTQKTDLLTAATLSASGDITLVSVTVGGTTKSGSITVPYATSAGSATSATSAGYATSSSYATSASSATSASTASYSSTETTSATGSTKIATTQYVINKIDSVLAASEAMIYKGTLGTGGTITALPATHSCGDTYKVITAGTYASVKCEIGDMIICITNGTAAADAHWTVVQSNLDGAVIGPASTVSGNLAIFDGTTGKLIKDSGKYVSASVPSNAVFTDTKNTAGTTNSASVKLFLVGATTQSANPQTYTNVNTYINSDNNLYSNGFVAATSVRAKGNDVYVGASASAQFHLQYDNTSKCVKFMFD